MLNAILKRLLNAVIIFLSAGMVVSLLLALIPDYYMEWGFGTRFLQNFKTFLTFDYQLASAEGVPIVQVLANRLSNSLVLIVGSLLMTMLIGIPMGILVARYPYHKGLKGLSATLKSLSSIPVLIWAVGLVTLFQLLLKRLIYFDYLEQSSGPWVLVLYLCPILCLAFGDSMIADIIRIVQDETNKVLQQDFIRALKARNVSVNRHLFRALSLPVVASFASKASYLIGGTVIVEWVFNIKGLGYQILNSIIRAGSKDYNLILAATMIFVAFSLVFYFISEITAVMADPRIREQG